MRSFVAIVALYLFLRFNGHFPGGPGLAGIRMSPFWILLERRMMEVVVTTGAMRHAKLQIVSTNEQRPVLFTAGCRCCCPTNSVRALKGESMVLYVESV